MLLVSLVMLILGSVIAALSQSLLPMITGRVVFWTSAAAGVIVLAAVQVFVPELSPICAPRSVVRCC
ncbi:hypothetical protein LX90_004753 [Lentzea flava]|nr:hypothetical protein [Lentzea flava]